MPLLPMNSSCCGRSLRQLTEADPALGAYLSGRARWRRLATVAMIYIVSALLLGLGVGAHLTAVLVAGVLLAPVAPRVS